MTADTVECPYCAETIKAAAIKCRYCQSDLLAPPAPEPWPAFDVESVEVALELDEVSDFTWGFRYVLTASNAFTANYILTFELMDAAGYVVGTGSDVVHNVGPWKQAKGVASVFYAGDAVASYNAAWEAYPMQYDPAAKRPRVWPPKATAPAPAPVRQVPAAPLAPEAPPLPPAGTMAPDFALAADGLVGAKQRRRMLELHDWLVREVGRAPGEEALAVTNYQQGSFGRLPDHILVATTNRLAWTHDGGLRSLPFRDVDASGLRIKSGIVMGELEIVTTAGERILFRKGVSLRMQEVAQHVIARAGG